MSTKNSTRITHALQALFEQTEQRIADGVRSPATLEMQRAHGVWLLAELGGDVPLRTLDESRLELITAPRKPPRRYGAETLRKRMSTVRAMLALAHRRRWIARVPALPQVIAPWRPRQRFLETYGDAVFRIFQALPLHRAEWFWLCLWTWQHASDVERMCWADVRLEAAAPAFLRRNTKNRKTPLWVAMPRPLAEVLQSKFARERPVPESCIVRPWPSRKHTLVMACYRLGLPPCNAIDLRHTGMTWAVRRLGVTPGVLAYAGHGSAAMASRTYAHALPAGLADVTAELNAFAGCQATTGTETGLLAHPGAFGEGGGREAV